VVRNPKPLIRHHSPNSIQNWAYPSVSHPDSPKSPNWIRGSCINLCSSDYFTNSWNPNPMLQKLIFLINWIGYTSQSSTERV